MLNIDYALRYAAMGWAVLPLVPGQKMPACEHGVNDATTDTAQIWRWWGASPSAGIGIACGAASGLIVVDIDPRNGGSIHEIESELGALPDTATAITGGGGSHYLLQYVDGVRSQKLRAGIDILSNGKYFVAEPSRHPTGGIYQWEADHSPVEDGVAAAPLPAAWITAMKAEKPATAAPSGTAGKIAQGGRDNAMSALAGGMRHFGMSEPEILAALLVANDQRCDPPLPLTDIARIAKSIARYEPDYHAVDAGEDVSHLVGASIPRAGLTLTSAMDLLREPAPIIWQVKKMLPTNSLIMVHGPSGSGKTFIALDVALCVATGTPYHGRAVTKGAVVVLAGEGHYGMRSRIAAWAQARGVSDLSGAQVSDRGTDLDTPAGVAAVASAIDALPTTPPALIVVDTVHRHMSGDENSAKDVGAFLRGVAALQQRYQCSAMLIHHTGNDELSQERGRGSSSWRAALDTEISVAPLQIDAGKVSRVLCRKQKDAPEFDAIDFALQEVAIPGWRDEDGNPVGSLVPAMLAAAEQGATEPHAKKGRPFGASGRHDRVIIALWHAGRERGATIDAWRTEYFKRSPAEPGAKYKAFGRERARAVDDGLVTVSDDFYVPNLKSTSLTHIFERCNLTEGKNE